MIPDGGYNSTGPNHPPLGQALGCMSSIAGPQQMSESDKPYTPFHPGTLLRNVRYHVVPSQLLYAVLAMAAPLLVTDG
ncbi:hypothetical protein PoMZ_08906 [Pyricularia oryzae]|uniref:Uncharacterized protein n=1 Tax=Pyricularia oryzae TaxID=318829 RepID=A0A4P7NIU4_PYROR|nr:hypothetical protein PoMZ_08906 [Pyricularia oryzae]